jgi:hypothetical protein
MADGGMTRREFLAAAGAGAAGAAVLGRMALAQGGPVSSAPAGRPPNIVVILADDLGYAELGCQGCRDIPTPHTDSIARAGVRFTQGYVTCPICAPTRAGLLTGRYQQRFGFETNPGRMNAAAEAVGLVVAGELFLGAPVMWRPLRNMGNQDCSWTDCRRRVPCEGPGFRAKVVAGVDDRQSARASQGRAVMGRGGGDEAVRAWNRPVAPRVIFVAPPGNHVIRVRPPGPAGRGRRPA